MIDRARLTLRGLNFARGSATILHDIDLSLGPGLTGILGPNGAGKSTLLRLILGLERPTRGSVSLDGTDIATRTRAHIARRIAYLAQQHVPAFPYRVHDVVTLGHLASIGFGRVGGHGRDTAVQTALSRMGITDLALRPYTELSGGERQAVLIARALAQGANVLVLDEPVSALDYGQQGRLWGQLRTLASEGYTIVCTSHDPVQARTILDRAILIDKGRVCGDGAAASVLSDAAIARLYGLETAGPGIGNT